MDTPRKTLVDLGFVHVTGLPTLNFCGGLGYTIESPSLTRNWGRYDYQNFVQVVVTTEGEVWIRWIRDDFLSDDVVSTIAPNGRGAMVPCSNGQQINSEHLAARMKDPDWKGNSGEFGW
jgi:hypothetical protein